MLTRREFTARSLGALAVALIPGAQFGKTAAAQQIAAEYPADLIVSCPPIRTAFPPIHPNCRCFMVYDSIDGGPWNQVWIDADE